MTLADGLHDYLQSLADFLEQNGVMELDPLSTPVSSPDAPAIDYKLRKIGSDPEQIMLLRVNFTSYQTIGNKHELTSNSKTHIRLAGKAFCRGEGMRFNV